MIIPKFPPTVDVIYMKSMIYKALTFTFWEVKLKLNINGEPPKPFLADEYLEFINLHIASYITFPNWILSRQNCSALKCLINGRSK